MKSIVAAHLKCKECPQEVAVVNMVSSIYGNRGDRSVFQQEFRYESTVTPAGLPLGQLQR